MPYFIVTMKRGVFDRLIVEADSAIQAYETADNISFCADLGDPVDMRPTLTEEVIGQPYPIFSRASVDAMYLKREQEHEGR
jgi:hypothetical protein